MMAPLHACDASIRKTPLKWLHGGASRGSPIPHSRTPPQQLRLLGSESARARVRARAICRSERTWVCSRRDAPAQGSRPVTRYAPRARLRPGGLPPGRAPGLSGRSTFGSSRSCRDASRLELVNTTLKRVSTLVGFPPCPPATAGTFSSMLVAYSRAESPPVYPSASSMSSGLTTNRAIAVPSTRETSTSQRLSAHFSIT